MQNTFKLNPEYRANVIAQCVSFIINCALYTITNNPLYIWICLSAITFIGIVSSQPKRKFWDINLVHHMLIIIIFYILSALSFNFHAVYFILIFIFTYIFYILKDSGYDKSFTVWTLIQALMFITSTSQLSFTRKILGTTLAFFEVQTVLFICFYFFKSPIKYIQEYRFLAIKNITLQEWINPKYEKVRLAIRGTLVAGLLYIVCVFYVSDDLRPNWAVITAVSALLRNDDEGGWHTIISGVIGSIFGFTMAFIVIKLDIYAPHLTPFILWVSLIAALVFMFEYTINKTYLTQILGICFTIVATISAYIVLDLNSNFYLHLRLVNNILGITFAFIAMCIWVILKKYNPAKIWI